MVRAFIVEDEPVARRHIGEILKDVDWIECVGEASNGLDAVRLIDAVRPDLVFLDIELPECSGLDVLDRATHKPAVIFTTAYDRYAVAAFELQALDYLLKPFGRDRFLAAIERARHMADADLPDSISTRAREAAAPTSPLERIFVRDRGKIVPVATRDILRLEAEDDYVRVHTAERTYLVYVRLAEFERRLDSSRFVRVHRSHVVNMDYVRCLTPSADTRLQIEMRDGTKLFASRSRSRELRHLAV